MKDSIDLPDAMRSYYKQVTTLTSIKLCVVTSSRLHLSQASHTDK